MKIQAKACRYPLNRAFVKIIENEIEKASIPEGSGAIVSFRSPDYSPETGGFHPVEIAVDPTGTLQYVTDFAFVGRPPYHDLAKEIDFDFSLESFQHFGIEHPLAEGKALFALYQTNFADYYSSGIYNVHVEPIRFRSAHAASKRRTGT